MAAYSIPGTSVVPDVVTPFQPALPPPKHHRICPFLPRVLLYFLSIMNNEPENKRQGYHHACVLKSAKGMFMPAHSKGSGILDTYALPSSSPGGHNNLLHV